MVDEDRAIVLRSEMVFPTPSPETARMWLTVVHEVARASRGRVIGEMFNWFD